MASKNFFKDNFVLIVGLALPVLLMFGFMIVSSLPNALGEPPKYDLVFSTNDSTNAGTTPVSVKLTVDKDGVLKAQYTRTPGNLSNGTNYYYNAWKKLYVYDAATRKVKELPFPYPAAMDKMSGTTEETVEATKAYKLDTNLESPDGFTLSYDGYSRSGFMGDLFFMGGHGGSEIRLRRGNSSFPLTPTEGNSPFYYGSAEFIGWATGKSQ